MLYSDIIIEPVYFLMILCIFEYVIYFLLLFFNLYVLMYNHCVCQCTSVSLVYINKETTYLLSTSPELQQIQTFVASFNAFLKPSNMHMHCWAIPLQL